MFYLFRLGQVFEARATSSPSESDPLSRHAEKKFSRRNIFNPSRVIQKGPAPKDIEHLNIIWMWKAEDVNDKVGRWIPNSISYLHPSVTDPKYCQQDVLK